MKFNILIDAEFAEGNRLFGKIRSYGCLSPCTVLSAGKDSVEVGFESPQFAPAPGQKLVLYTDKGFVVAGGTIFP